MLYGGYFPILDYEDIFARGLTYESILIEKERLIKTPLGRFQFSKDQVTTPLGKLSGGERARVALLKLLLEENNILLLDEPTNHLDMDAKDTLEEVLNEYDGAIVTVSHDRWFLDQIVTQNWEINDGIVTKYFGNYTDYIRRKKGLPPLAEGEESLI